MQTEPNVQTEPTVPAELKTTAVPTPGTQRDNASLIRKAVIGVVATLVLGAGASYGYQAFQHVASHEETDDAYITGHLHQVSTRVNGTVAKVLVDDNEHVKQGQVLVMLDPRDFRVKVQQALANMAQAQRRARAAQVSVQFQDTTAQGQDTNARGGIDNAVAGIARAQAEVREAQSRIEAAQASLKAKDAELDRAALDYRRFENLEAQGAISTSQKDSAKRDYLVALENRNTARQEIAQAQERFEQARQTVSASKAELVKAQAQVQLARASSVQTRVSEGEFQTNLAAVEAARAALDEAQLNLSYSRIVAPTSGRIGKKTVEEGQRVEPGQPLLTIVEDNPWVVANYKETQLKQMVAGQKVEIKIDAFPNHRFEGTVLSFAPASGSSFAILPTDNATGNFTKIVQRLPVKIVFTADSIDGYADRLTPGLSVITSIDVSSGDTRDSVVGMR